MYTCKDITFVKDSYGQILGKVLILIQNKSKQHLSVSMCIEVIKRLMGNRTDHQKCPESDHYIYKAYRRRNTQSTHFNLILSQVYLINLHTLIHCSM